MRQSLNFIPFRFALTKAFSVFLSLAFVGIEVAPAFARNNDDYQTSNKNYGSQVGYSAQSFELQMQRMNARMQSFNAPQIQRFDTHQFSSPKLNLSYQPTIRFPYSPQGKPFEVISKPATKLNVVAVQRPTFTQNVGQVFKGIGSGHYFNV
jgi:hypothetical protein